MPITASRAAVIPTIAAMRAAIGAARERGARIAFVPTMGALHEGHLRLVDIARTEADVVAMSIFVNPLQFGPSEDFTRYPRDEAGDVEKAGARGVSLVFLPTVDMMYPGQRSVSVVPRALHDRWEGAVRPGHFEGVLTVVAKLLHIVTPDVAIFGQKDIQQATLIRALARDLDFATRIVVAPTVREPDGLAMSSRNVYLNAEARRSALALSRSLFAMRDAFDRGERDAASLLSVGREMLGAESAVVVDYLALVDPDRLEPVARAEPGTIGMVAARVGPTRLIDNVILGSG
jgi:pantoate--beta-alanine ligase